MAVKDEDEDVRNAGVMSLMSLAHDGVVIWIFCHIWHLITFASWVSGHQQVSLI
jgi:hypothetical protein